MLQVENLTFRYPGNNEDTLKGLSFSIDRGEIFGFLGPSGSGKSTTQKILYKLLSGHRGVVTFNNKPLNEWGRDFYEQIGVSFELPNHYLKLTAEENLEFFGSFYPKVTNNLAGLLKSVGLNGDANKAVGEFSKGMKMRLNFIRALLHDPPVLFLDEPTSGMDPINARKIKDIIKSFRARGKTVFITTHNMFDADQLCDRVALLHNGRILALDTPANLKLRYGSRSVKITPNSDNREERIFPMENLSENQEFMEILQRNAIGTIHSQEATLEEVFIKITGAQLV